MEDRVQVFLDLVADELARARQKHPPIHSLHEGYAVLLEEVEELWAEVRKRGNERSPVTLVEELAQIAAMATRIYVDVLVGESE